MRLETIVGTAAATLDLGEVEFIGRGERVLIAAADSVATATLRVTFGAIQVTNGQINIEAGTDRVVWPDDLVASFIAPRDGKMIATVGGTAADFIVRVLVLERSESIPW